tara:strand:- start:3149 stop:3802 length:654 start_codon:yes stop_codon:yes gene_type:complete
MKYKLTFLLDSKNPWFEKYLRKYNFRLKNKYIIKISKNYNNIKNQDIVFILSYTRILPSQFLKKNKLNLIVHESKLPKDKGFAPVAYQVLKNKRTIHLSLFEAVKKVDSGPIFLRDKFILNGTELSEELRAKQAFGKLKIIKKFLLKYPKLISKKQTGKGNFNKKRKPKDSKININKSIKSQFNLLRVSDNESYPCYFEYKKQKYVLKIYKKNKYDN